MGSLTVFGIPEASMRRRGPKPKTSPGSRSATSTNSKIHPAQRIRLSHGLAWQPGTAAHID